MGDCTIVERVGYWLAVTLAAYAAYRLALNVADRLTAGSTGPMRQIGRLLALLLASAAMTLPVWLASYLHTPRLWPTLWNLVDLFPSVLVIGAMIMAVLLLLERIAAYPADSGEQDGRGSAANHRPEFLDRLPRHLGSELIALQMEDHYVRAHTAKGSALILMRMRDAVGQLSGLEGAQVHRSWWVAGPAVRRIGGTGRAPRIELTNGLVVPVARDRREMLSRLGA